jgi:hypothetical protein
MTLHEHTFLSVISDTEINSIVYQRTGREVYVNIIVEIRNVQMIWSENVKEIGLCDSKTKTRKYVERYIRLVIYVN